MRRGVNYFIMKKVIVFDESAETYDKWFDEKKEDALFWE
jgi:hypothetical protein